MIILLFFYIICGLLSYAGTFAYFQREFHEISEQSYKGDLVFAISFGLFGPLGLSITCFGSKWFKHGLKWW